MNLLERLRKRHSERQETTGGDTPTLYGEAADEIEQLRSTLTEIAESSHDDGIVLADIAQAALSTKDTDERTGFEVNCARCGKEYGGIGRPLCPECFGSEKDTK